MNAKQLGIHLAILCSLSLVLANRQEYQPDLYWSPQGTPFRYYQPPPQYSPYTASRIALPHALPNVANANLQPSNRANSNNVANQITSGSEKFALNMISAIASATEKYDSNFVIAPFSIWSLMLLIAEGSKGPTFTQLQNVLQMPNDFNSLRAAYKELQRLLLVNTTTVELAVNQALFTDSNRPIEASYANVLQNEYSADYLQVDFKSPINAVKTINDHISARTQGKIKDVVKPDDLIETQLLLTSAVFFRGQWKFPFNVSNTRMQPFYDENGGFIAEVPMMIQRQILPYTTIIALDASILELPYGKQDRLCMLLVLPRRNTTLSKVFQTLPNFNIAKINYELHKYDNTNDYDESEIDLTLPKFNIDSDLELRTLLDHLGIKDVFDPAKADLTKISKDNTYVSRIFHKSVIEVNEVGTVAAGVSVGTVSFKQSPLEFTFNRPFGFLITDKVTNTLLFAGQVRHPLLH